MAHQSICRSVLITKGTGWTKRVASSTRFFGVFHLALRGSSIASRLCLWMEPTCMGDTAECMTTNLSVCINAVLKGTRFFPISAIVRATYERLQQLWIRKWQEAHAQVVAEDLRLWKVPTASLPLQARGRVVRRSWH
ncbi:hypothetical protein PIB30_083496 [Stylosanthes scabra]|uniref:Uncharacterized protein n=1 Tax=Stylosanthes scabra TaxID=79078 RepID=A0ABU6QRV9_9FABA|nr:hypothetical protein [Stylosanthes scabra]